LWNDTTTSAQCDQITDHFGGPAGVIALVGNTMRTGYTAPKILWLRQNEPENWKKTRSILLPHDYLNFWLTGAKRMEFGDCFRYRFARCENAPMVTEGRRLRRR
jgi:xylulokinase